MLRSNSRLSRHEVTRNQTKMPHRQRSSVLGKNNCNDNQVVTNGLTQWHEPNQPMLWMGTTEEAMACDTTYPLPCGISSMWKVLLLSDGSVTRHLQLLTGSKVQVDCLSMVNIGDDLQGLPPDVTAIESPRVQRQVLLRAGVQSTPLVYACSWWNADQIDEYLRDKSQPIWVSLSQGHIELYREVQYLYYGHNKNLEELLQCQGPLWGRQYIFWHNQRPLTLIYEVFSNKLKEQIEGPCT